MDTPETNLYMFLHNYANAVYSISLQSYDIGLSNKPRYILLTVLVLKISPKQSKSTKHLIGFLRHCMFNFDESMNAYSAWCAWCLTDTQCAFPHSGTRLYN